ncbi:MAG: PepSY domain-containing protein [Ignavibacteriaceae bacterium]|nr:PepSY domain-containing protein [Ignavibacteriaceae bacterium]
MTNKFFLKTSLLVSALTLFIIVATLTSCKCRACDDQEQASVPIEVLAKADSFIIVSTSKEFFDKYITVDFYRTKHTPPYYEMAYKFFMPEKPYVDATIKFTVDSVGNVLMNRDIVGIPRCKNFPEECDFNIDEQTARQIASEMELKEGIKEWEAGFLWDFKLKRYVWRILSTLTEFSSGDNYKATGQEMVIDPNTGEVLALNDWRVN